MSLLILPIVTFYHDTCGIKSFVANPDAVTKWCLNRADQAENVNALKETATIYSSSEKYKPLRPSQILISEKLVAEVIRVLEEEYVNPFNNLVTEDCWFNWSSGSPVNDQLADEILNTNMLGRELAMKFAKERLMVNGKKKFHEALPKLSLQLWRWLQNLQKWRRTTSSAP